MATTAPSEQEKKYDRQLRLWGAAGQQALQKAKVCLLNASGAGSETLKNLVLPGVSFVIVDKALVTEADLGTNFFLTPEDLGKPRGERCAELLKELNPDDVTGGSLAESPEHIIETNPDFFREQKFTLVVATQLPEQLTVKLAVALHRDHIPLVVVRSYGLFGFVRVQSPDVSVLETFPDQVTEDLRLANPFPELQEFVNQIGNPDDVKDGLLHGHIPYVALLVHYYQKWRAQTGYQGTGNLSVAQRREIRALVEGGRRQVAAAAAAEDEGGAANKGPKSEENFQEAINSLHKLNQPPPPDALQRLFAHPEADRRGEDGSDAFWITVAAAREFHRRHGVLPITGKVNDMTSTTELFIGLQKCYQQKAAQDADEVHALAVQLAGGSPGRAPPKEYVVAFCRNIWSLRHIHFRTLSEETAPGTARADYIKKLDGDLPWYILLRAADKYHQEHGQFPGGRAFDDEAWEADVPALQKTAKALLADLGVAVPSEIDAAKVQEWVRYGAGEVHTVSAVVGGVAAQECIKLITNQRVPLANTLIFNGIEGTFSVHEL